MQEVRWKNIGSSVDKGLLGCCTATERVRLPWRLGWYWKVQPVGETMVEKKAVGEVAQVTQVIDCER